MRRFLPLLLLSLILLPLQAHSQSTVINGVTYKLDTSTNEATANGYSGAEETLVIPATIEYDGVIYNVTGIGSLLSRNTVVKHLTLPSSITSILNSERSANGGVSMVGAFFNCALEDIDMSNMTEELGFGKLDCMFYNCESLVRVKLPKLREIGSYMFYQCNSLQSVTFNPNGSPIEIDASAFAGCTSLQSITLPEGITSIGDKAFWGCSILDDINLSELSDLTSIGESAFAECIALDSINFPEGLTSIGYGAFEDCSKLQNVTFPSSLSTIDGYGFSGCSALTSIDLSNTKVTSLGSVFRNCTSLKSVVLPKNLTALMASTSGAFAGCSALSDINLSQTKVTIIGVSTFSGCTSLTSLDLPDTLTEIRRYGFSNSGLTSITFPASLTTVGENAFTGCAALEYVDMSQTGVTTLEGYTFASCTALKTILLPPNLTTIGTQEFKGSGVEKLTMPASLNTMGKNAFQNCTSLESIEMSATQVTAIPDYAFSGCTKLASVKFPAKLVSIGQYAFNLSGIVSIDLPASVTTLNVNVFQNCTELTSAALSKTAITTIPNYTFDGCSKLSSVQLPGKLTTINNYAFRKAGLTSLSMPATVSTLGTYVFQNCTSLVTADMSKSALKSIPNYTFNGCSSLTSVLIPDVLTSLGTNVFQNCSALKSVDLSRSKITQLPSTTFGSCSALTTVKLPETVTTLGASCFSSSGISVIVSGDNKAADGCVNLPSGLTSFSTTALSSCTKLQTVDLGGLKSDLKLSYSTFSGLTALTKFVFPKIANLANWKQSNTTTAYLPSTTSPLSVTLPSGESTPTIPNSFFRNINVGEVIFDEVPPTAIGTYAFYANPIRGSVNEDGTTTFRIPDGVRSIGSNAFQGTAAKHLVADSICLTGTLSAISASAFANAECKVLFLEKPVVAEVENMAQAPARVEAQSTNTPSLTIGATAFSSTTGGPNKVVCYHDVPPTMPDNGFSTYQYTYGELEVGYSSANAYRTATGWQNFSDNLVTGVEDIEIDGDNDGSGTERNDDRIYNLQGILIPADRPLSPGIYIRNGKKIYIQ